MNRDAPIPQVSAQELEARIRSNSDVFLLDVRNPDEWEICKLENAVTLPLPTLQMAAQEIIFGGDAAENGVVAQIPRDRDVIVYCHTGVRSQYAIMMLRELGYEPTRLINLSGGIHAWALSVDPTMPTY
ncbi:MAG: rhodanese-like domain-containing protein [Anaerolineae bacterium]|nr:rhodanese-like domain-containing protein [Anaerolineae bacterium]